jgi:hypothetical protein
MSVVNGDGQTVWMAVTYCLNCRRRIAAPGVNWCTQCTANALQPDHKV